MADMICVHIVFTTPSMILVEFANDEVKNLRDTYVRKKRVEKESKNGQAGKQKKWWKNMDAMSFLEASTAFRR